MNDKNKLCSVIFLGIILLFFVSWFALLTGSITTEVEVTKDIPVLNIIPIPTTFTFWVLFSVIIVLFATIYYKNSIFGGSISNMKKKVLKFYYSKLIDAMIFMVTGFLIVLSILWSQTGGQSIIILQVQSLLMLALLAYVGGSLYFTIIHDFKNEFWKRNETKGDSPPVNKG